MNTSELLQIGRLLLLPTFIGVFAVDNIPNYLPNPCGFIVNTQGNNLLGRHWLSVIINQRKCIIFNSLGNSPPSFLMYQLHTRLNNITFHYNTNQLQLPNTDTCGLHCIYFLYMLL